MPITVICGHYGCGKTNLALNLALEAAGSGPVTLAADSPGVRRNHFGYADPAAGDTVHICPGSGQGNHRLRR